MTRATRGWRRIASPRRAALWRRAARDGLSLVGAFMTALLVIGAPGGDAHAYWSVNAAHPYSAQAGVPGAFLYSPVAALVALLFQLLPFAAFRLLVMAAELGALVYLAGPWALALAALFPVMLELALGNIHLLLAVAIVIGFRYPAAWSFVLLTKATPGIGLLWFAVRREWRSLGIALGATAALVAASAVIAPGWWPDWFAMLASSAAHPLGVAPDFGIALWLRLPAAALLVAWGARTDRPWTVPVAAMLALPVLWWESLVMLVGVVPLVAGLGVTGAALATARPGARDCRAR
jgi:hypothetical protein